MTDDHSHDDATLAVDVGGTFTDVVRWDGTRLTVTKTSTTADQADGVVTGATRLTDADTRLLHGTTVATNALLERRGAPTALVTDAGFEDVLEIGRQDRPSLYDPFADRPAPLVDRSRRIGVDPDADPSDTVDRVMAAGVEAVAVCLLDAWADGSTERRIADAIASRLDVAVSTSHRVAGEFREFERMSTTVLNATLGPEVRRYLTSLRERARTAGLPAEIEVLRSSGGLMSLEDAAELPAAILLSGPAGGVVAAAALGEVLGHDTVVSFDMGGTSTDVCRITSARPEVAYERTIDGHPCRMPTVAIETVGAGGGSVVWSDSGGALRVGPHSAGARPGPACYGRGGTEPTVTDANVALGRIAPDARLVGEVALDRAAAVAALGLVGGPLGLDATATALGAVDVVEEHMARALRMVSVEQGVDPRDAWLVSFGGAGGLHATSLARRLDMRGVVVPVHAGVFSALGLLLSPRREDRTQGVRIRGDAEALARHAERLTADVDDATATVRIVLDVRHVGQAHETPVEFTPGESWTTVRARFDDAHRRHNGFTLDDDAEVVTIRAEVTRPPALRVDQLPRHVADGDPRRGERDVVLDEGVVRAPVWWRPGLAAGARVPGPAVIEEAEATTLIGPGEQAVVHDSGALEVTW